MQTNMERRVLSAPIPSSAGQNSQKSPIVAHRRLSLGSTASRRTIERRYSIPNIFLFPPSSQKIEAEEEEREEEVSSEDLIPRPGESELLEHRDITLSFFGRTLTINQKAFDTAARNISLSVNEVGLGVVHIAMFGVNILVSLGKIIPHFPHFFSPQKAYIPISIVGDIGFCLSLLSQRHEISQHHRQTLITLGVFLCTTIALNVVVFGFPEKMGPFFIGLIPIFIFFPLLHLGKDIKNRLTKRYSNNPETEGLLSVQPHAPEDTPPHTKRILNLLSLKNFFLIIKLVATHAYIIQDFIGRKNPTHPGEVEKIIFSGVSILGALFELILLSIAWPLMEE